MHDDRSRRCFAVIALCFLIGSATALAAGKRRAVGQRDNFCDYGQDVPGVLVPPEFCIRKFVDVPTPRVLLFAPNGDLFVSSPKRVTPGGAPPGSGAIFLFRQANASEPPRRFTFAEGDAFETVHGLLISNDLFYYTVEGAVYAVPYRAGDVSITTDAPALIADLTAQESWARFAHTLAADVRGDVHVSRGMGDNNVCPPEDPRIGAVLRIGGEHAKRGDVVVNGLRNPLYIRCMPWDACYAAELSGDAWDDRGGNEKLIELHDRDTYGYPCCVDRNIPNRDIPSTPDCSRVVESKLTFPLHHTPFGFDWERTGSWPQPYARGFFVGLHGKFGTWDDTGLQWAPTDAATHLPVTATKDFATGLFGRHGTISRVADVLFSPDGRLFFSDDQGGAIYWIAPRTLRRPPR